MHQSDFGIQANWCFFATSHGKSPCDGIGGTAKRSTAHVSLQRPYNNQILSAESMLDYCINHAEGIVFKFISKANVDAVRRELVNKDLTKAAPSQVQAVSISSVQCHQHL